MNRLVCLNGPPRPWLIAWNIANPHNRPHARPRQQLLVRRDTFIREDKSAQAKICEIAPVAVAGGVEIGAHLVDDHVGAPVVYAALDDLVVGAVEVVLAHNLLNLLDSLGDYGVVVGLAVLRQQVFDHIRRHGKIAFHLKSQVLAHDELPKLRKHLSAKLRVCLEHIIIDLVHLPSPFNIH